MTDRGLKCPACGKALEITIDHRLGERVSISIEPKPGGFINGKVAGGTLQDFAALLESVAKDAGFRAEATLRGLSLSETGGMRFDLEMIPIVAGEAKGDGGNE